MAVTRLHATGQDRWFPLLGAVGVAGYVGLTVWATTITTYNAWGGFLVAPALIAVSLPVLKRVANDVTPYKLLVLALVAKVLCALVRYWQSYILYRAADTERYHDAGVRIAQSLHDGLPWAASGPFPGTAFIEGFTGYVYWAMGPTRIGGFFVFSWLGFWGLLFFAKAFETAMPHAQTRRYAYLVLFLPSLLFWPSSIGKEGWMTLCLGLATFGAARLLARGRYGVLCLALGLFGAGLVRPHMSAILFAALFVGYLARPYNRASHYGPLLKGVGVVVLLVAGSIVLARAETFFSQANKGVDATSVSSVVQSTAARTDEGGSAFEATPVTSPLQLPSAAMAVLLRPFPWEARNVQSLAAAAESMFLLLLLYRARATLRRLPSYLRREPWVALSITYVLLFVTAFSGFSNFGVLTRQRVQVFPFVLVLLALPAVAAKVKRVPYVPARLILVNSAAQPGADQSASPTTEKAYP